MPIIADPLVLIVSYAALGALHAWLPQSSRPSAPDGR